MSSFTAALPSVLHCLDTPLAFDPIRIEAAATLFDMSTVPSFKLWHVISNQANCKLREGMAAHFRMVGDDAFAYATQRDWCAKNARTAEWGVALGVTLPCMLTC